MQTKQKTKQKQTKNKDKKKQTKNKDKKQKNKKQKKKKPQQSNTQANEINTKQTINNKEKYEKTKTK